MLDIFKNSCQQWHLTVNVKKTPKVVAFCKGRLQKLLNVVYGDTHLDVQYSNTHLGKLF